MTSERAARERGRSQASAAARRAIRPGRGPARPAAQRLGASARRGFAAFACAGLLAAATASSLAVFGPRRSAHAAARAAAAPASQGAPAAGGSADAALESLQARIIAVSERVKPVVVHVEAIVRINDRRSQVMGSGVVASPDGRILTNQHVVEKAEKVTVTVPGHKRKYPARIIGSDKQTDIALLRIDPEEPLVAARFGSAADVRVGQWVLAIGNPYGLDGTVSFGIVSAKGRNLEIPDLINDFIQTDAMIDRGSSGGPLVDLEGRVIGINSRGQGRGIGFTIPIDTALDVMRQLEAGRIERGWLGITMQPLDRDLADYLGVPDVTGVLVNSVAEGSPAERAGLRPGDILTAIGGVPLEAEKEEDLGAIQRRVAALQPGTRTEVEILRDRKRRRLQVVLGSQPKVEPAEEQTDDGFLVEEITENLYRDHRLSTRAGAFVSFVSRGSPAAEAGLRAGDVIRRIDGMKVDDLDDFRRAMAGTKGKKRFLVTAQRGFETKFLLVQRGTPAHPGGRESPAAEPTESPGTGEAPERPLPPAP